MKNLGLSGRDIRVVENLHPQQQPSPLKVRRSVDFRSQRMIKYPQICHFHKLSHYYHAGLLEGELDTEFYVPRPFKLTIHGKFYIPTIYYARKGIRYVAEIKKHAEYPDEMRIPLEEYFKLHRMEFVVLNEDEIFEREIAAQNWILIVQNLLSSSDLDTEITEWDVYEKITQANEITFGEIIDLGNRSATELQEASVYRLLHSGKIQTGLESQFFGVDSVLQPCD